MTDSLLRFQLEADLAELVEAIRVDRVSGPIDLARQGVVAVLRLTEKEHYERPMHINLEVQGIARALLEARPDCMPLANLASETARPLAQLYGRGKDEGARMRGDLRARVAAWSAALEARASRLDAQRARFSVDFDVVTAAAVDRRWVYLAPNGAPCAAPRARLVVAGAEKFVPPNYDFPDTALQQISLAECAGFLTGDTEEVVSAETIRIALAPLRFETTLL